MTLKTCSCSVNPRLPALISACLGLVFSLLTIVSLLVLLGQRHVVAASAQYERLLPPFCVFYMLVLMLKASSEVLLICAAFKRNADEMWTGLVINKVTVALLFFGVMSCALLRVEIATVVGVYATVLIALSVCIWLSAYKAFQCFENQDDDQQPDHLLPSDEQFVSIHI